MRIEIDPRALAEASEAQARYAAIHPRIGDDFAQTVQVALLRIQQEPLLYQTLTRRSRRCVLRGFPYTIVYELHPGFLRVIALMHQSRKPGYWRRR